MKQSFHSNLARTFTILAFVWLYFTVGAILNLFHLHGWRWIVWSFPISAVIFGVGRFAIRRIAASTKTATRTPPSGNRAARRKQTLRK